MRRLRATEIMGAISPVCRHHIVCLADRTSPIDDAMGLHPVDFVFMRTPIEYLSLPPTLPPGPPEHERVHICDMQSSTIVTGFDIMEFAQLWAISDMSAIDLACAEMAFCESPFDDFVDLVDDVFDPGPAAMQLAHRCRMHLWLSHDGADPVQFVYAALAAARACRTIASRTVPPADMETLHGHCPSDVAIAFVEDAIDLLGICGPEMAPKVPGTALQELAEKCELIEMQAAAIPPVGPHRDLADRMLKRSLAERHPGIRPHRNLEQ